MSPPPLGPQAAAEGKSEAELWCGWTWGVMEDEVMTVDVLTTWWKEDEVRYSGGMIPASDGST